MTISTQSEHNILKIVFELLKLDKLVYCHCTQDSMVINIYGIKTPKKRGGGGYIMQRQVTSSLHVQ